MVSELPSVVVVCTVVLWGAIWGSFANVVIARLPLGGSVAFPPSHCPQCEEPIRWFDNIPVLSWVLLRGRCRACSAPISKQYPMVELGGIGCSLVAAFLASGGVSLWRLSSTPLLEVVIVWMFLSYFLLVLMMLAVIDVKHLLLPHRLTGILTLLAFVYAFIGPHGGDWRGFVPQISLVDSLIGFCVAYGGLYVFATGYQLLRGRQGIGGGDFMLFGALGAWFGWEALPVLMLLAAFQGVAAFGLAQLFFPHWIYEVDDASFWDGRSGEGAEPSPAEASREDIRSLTLEKDAESGVERDMAQGVDHASGGAEASESLGRGLAFGPFLCLAAIEYLWVGPAYLLWLNGGF